MFLATRTLSVLSPNLLAPCSKAANFNLEAVLNLKDINALSISIAAFYLFRLALPWLSLWLFRFYYGVVATTWGSGETVRVKDNLMFSMFPVAHGSQATWTEVAVLRWPPSTVCNILLQGGTRACRSGTGLLAHSSHLKDFSHLFWVWELFLSSMLLPLFFAYKKLFVWVQEFWCF